MAGPNENETIWLAMYNLLNYFLQEKIIVGVEARTDVFAASPR